MRPRVVLVTTSFPLQTDSSSGVFVARLAEHLAAGADIQVITPAATRPAESDGARPYRLSTVYYAPRRWRRLAHRPGGIPVALARRDPVLLLLPALVVALVARCVAVARKSDLLHANWAFSGVVAGLAGRLTGRPVITTLRGDDIARVARSRLDRVLLRLCLRWSFRLVTVSPELERRVRSLYPREASRVTFIPNGVEERFYRLGERSGTESRTAASRERRLIAVGSLIERKGLDTIVRALALLPPDPPTSLILLGDGPERQSLAALARSLGVADRVELPGAVPASEVDTFLSRADVFVLASRSEGRPNALLEAMAAGLPVVASDIDGVRGLIRDRENGLLFSPAGHQELASRLHELGSDPALAAKLGAAARDHLMAAGLTWPAAAARYLDLYRQALATPSKTGEA